MTFALATLACLAIAQTGPGNVVYHSKTGRIVARNFDRLNTNWQDKKAATRPGETRIKLEGSLAIVDSPEKGVSATGQTIELAWAQPGGKKFEIRSAIVQGRAAMTFDSDWAYRSQIAFAQESGLQPPKPNLTARSGRVDSDEIEYAGDSDQGTLSLSHPWTYKETDQGVEEREVEGHPAQVHFDQVFECDGTSGQLILGPGKDGEINQIQTGTIRGPVHFKLIRKETVGDTKASTVTSYVGVADRVDINMKTNPGTVTASGHVKVDRMADGYPSNIDVDWLVLTVSPEMEPLGLQMGTGTIKASDKGGSR
ncbi:MAG: hypothetical protein P4L46_16215 [Fimbriimonas sp.]|nr:hypothetical protein [Fimbriimonas sp.]